VRGDAALSDRDDGLRVRRRWTPLNPPISCRTSPQSVVLCSNRRRRNGPHTSALRNVLVESGLECPRSVPRTARGRPVEPPDFASNRSSVVRFSRRVVQPKRTSVRVRVKRTRGWRPRISPPRGTSDPSADGSERVRERRRLGAVVLRTPPFRVEVDARRSVFGGRRRSRNGPQTRPDPSER
jgi:hypothetical protein